MNRQDVKGARAESGALCALALACYLAAFACVLTLSYSLAALAAEGVERRASRMAARDAF